MVFAHYKIYLNIAGTKPLLDNLRLLFNRHPIMDNFSTILSCSPFPSWFAMLEKLINPLVALTSSFITVFTLPYPLIQPFNTYWAFACFITICTNDFRAPFFLGEPFYRLLFHVLGKLHHLRLNLMPQLRFSLSVIGEIIIASSVSFGSIAEQFSTNSRWMNTYLLRNPKSALLGKMTKSC
jgi:hypothetical protein